MCTVSMLLEWHYASKEQDRCEAGVKQVCHSPVLLSVGRVRCSSVVSAGDSPSSASQPLHTHFPGHRQVLIKLTNQLIHTDRVPGLYAGKIIASHTCFGGHMDHDGC